MLQVIEGREVTGGHATLRHRVPVTNAQKGVGTPTAAREIPRLPAITMSVPEDPRIGGFPYQRSQCQPRRTQESKVLVDPPAPWGTRCREPGGGAEPEWVKPPSVFPCLTTCRSRGLGTPQDTKGGTPCQPDGHVSTLKRKARSEGASSRPRHLGMRVQKGILVIRRWRHSHMLKYRRPR